MSGLDARIGVDLGPLSLDVALEVGDREVVALLGPNGAGKSTVVRALAGLQPLDDGRVVLDGEVLDDVAEGTHVPTEARSIGVVFQQHLLFPRLSVVENVAFALRSRGVDRRVARRHALGWLERLGVDEHAEARPRTLSGGQAQRVALARALAADPRLLLLDEPLSALDATTRSRVRTELRHHLATFEGARLLVTHDPLDAIVLADRLVVVEDGRVTQVGTPAEVTARPATSYAADLVGINLLRGRRIDPHTIEVPEGGLLTVADALPVGAETVAASIRPRAVALHREVPGGSPRNTWHATIVDLELDRDRVRVSLDGTVPVVAEVTPDAVRSLGLRPGDRVWAAVKAVDIDVHDA